MDTIDFAKYLASLSVPLYPNARDEPGLQVAILVDSGPGRLNAVMLAEMKLLGFYLLPGVPNTTHITQPTDQNYGRFKDIYQKNLTKLTEHRELRKATIQQGDVPLLVFGGLADNVDIELQNAFSIAFLFERNQAVWKKKVFEPFTRNCLESNKVCSGIVFLPDGTIDLEANPMTVVLVALEKKNKKAVAVLNKYEHDGNKFLKKAPRLDPKQSSIAVSLPHTRERQDLLVKCSTAGSRWNVTHGDSLNCEDFLFPNNVN